MIDPVCGMRVTPETAAAAWDHEGITYHFCSVGCLARFRDEPGDFLDLGPGQRSM